MNLRSTLLTLVACGLMACPGPELPGDLDSGTGARVDGGATTVDGGVTRVDGGGGMLDSGTVGSDAGMAADAGGNDTDAGNMVVDAGNMVVDAGNGSTDAGTGSTDAGARFTINGVRVTHFINATRVLDAPVDPTIHPLLAYSATGSTFTSLPITYRDGGMFSFESPTQTYYVGSDRRYFVSNSPSIDLGSFEQGRPDAPVFTGETRTFVISATGMSPFDSNNDGFQLASESVYEQAWLFTSDSITPGTTSLSSVAFDQYVSIIGLNDLEAAKGDTAVISQTRTISYATDAGTATYTRLVASASTGPIDSADGVTTTVTLPMTVLPSRAVTFDWRGQQWRNLASSVHPAAQSSSLYLTLSATTDGTAHGWVGYLSELLSASLTTVPDGLLPMSYANPRSSWGEIGSVFATYRVPVQIGSSTPFQVSTYAALQATVSELSALSLSPIVTPPASLKIDGLNAQGTPVIISSVTPAISWSGVPSGDHFFTVRVREVYAAAGATRAGPIILTCIFSGALGASVRLPPGYLISGKSYVIIVEEGVQDAPFSGLTAPFYFGTRLVNASAVTSLITVE